MKLRVSPDGAAVGSGGRSRIFGKCSWSSRVTWVALGLAAVAAYFVIAGHAGYLVAILPWLLLAACPLMHVFMHRGHHGSHGHSAGAQGVSRDEP